MHGVHHDHLIVLVHGVLVEPVGVEHAQGAAAARGALLGDRPQVARELQLLHTLVHGLAVADTLWERRGEHGMAGLGGRSMMTEETPGGRAGQKDKTERQQDRPPSRCRDRAGSDPRRRVGLFDQTHAAQRGRETLRSLGLLEMHKRAKQKFYRVRFLICCAGCPGGANKACTRWVVGPA